MSKVNFIYPGWPIQLHGCYLEGPSIGNVRMPAWLTQNSNLFFRSLGKNHLHKIPDQVLNNLETRKNLLIHRLLKEIVSWFF